MKVMIVIENTVQAERAVAFYAAQLHAPDSEVVLVGLRSQNPLWSSLDRSKNFDAGLAEARIRTALNLAWHRLEDIGATYKTHIAQGDFADTVLQIVAAEGCGHVIVPQGQKYGHINGFLGRKSGGRIGRLMELTAVPITVLARSPGSDQSSARSRV